MGPRSARATETSNRSAWSRSMQSSGRGRGGVEGEDDDSDANGDADEELPSSGNCAAGGQSDARRGQLDEWLASRTDSRASSAGQKSFGSQDDDPGEGLLSDSSHDAEDEDTLGV